MRFITRHLLVAALLLSACTRATDVRIGDMLTLSRQNEVAALEKYQWKRVRLTGVVTDVGIAERSSVHSEGTREGPRTWTVDSKQVKEQLAYVELLAEDGQKGRAVCYFEPDHRSDAVDFRKGAAATVTGDVSNFEETKKETVVYLSSCRRDR